MTYHLTSNNLPYLHRNSRSSRIHREEIRRVYWEETRRGIDWKLYEPYWHGMDLEYASWRYQD